MTTFFGELLWIATFVGRAFLHILPYLALSIPLAVYLKRAGLSRRIEGALKKNEALAVLVATLVGALSPFCSCGVVPIIAALLTGGMPLAPVMAFWLASPSMDPEIFFLSVGSLGWELAVWRLGATFAMSLGAGYATLLLERKGYIGSDILRGDRIKAAAGRMRLRPVAAPRLGSAPLAVAACCAAPAPAPASSSASASGCGCSSPSSAATPASAALAPAASSGCGCASRSGSGSVAANACGCGDSAPKTPADTLRAFARDALGVLGRLFVFMGLAFLLEALITRYVPSAAVAGLLGKESAFAVPLAALVGIPFYTTGVSALGIVAGLLGQGMSDPAALAFLVGGAVTTLPAMSAVFGIVKPRVFALYLGFCAAGALAAGYALQLVQAF